MQIFLVTLKSFASILTILQVLIVLAFIFYKQKKLRWANIFAIAAIFVFILSSTKALPYYLASKLERQNRCLQSFDNIDTLHPVYLYVLGSGYSLDKSMPPSLNLCTAAKGRLMEGLRLYHHLPKSILVTSGNSLHNQQTQASVTKKAAIELGADSTRVETLDSPLTTMEEARDFAKKYGKDASVIIVTDALHMPRALQFFKQQGLHPAASPASYSVHDDVFNTSFISWPSIKSIELMDELLHEYLGNLKAVF